MRIPRYVVSDAAGVRTEGRISMPRPPAIPASLAVLVTLLGLGLMYWSLTGLGLLRTGDVQAATSSPDTSSGSGGGGAKAPLKS